MTYQEAGQVLLTIKASYPNSFGKMTQEDARQTASVWASMFKERDGAEVLNAVKTFILTDTDGFAPSIGQINALITKTSQNANMSELEAWGLVRKAISNSAWSSDTEFAKLPELIQKTIGSATALKEWALMQADQVDSVVSSNFQRSYRAKVKNAEFEAKLPAELTQRLETTDWKQLN